VALSLFRVNNRMLVWGDRLVAPLGLTSARWRDLGANRQNVQRIVNDLADEALIGFAPNPHHKRAQLVVLKAKGRDAYDAAIALYRPQVEALAADFSSEELTAAGRVMQALRARLESDAG